ncbi:hypothetical protein MLD38_007343 [Melastoma candidum]|uniref:Uncharacterized protein n=1 Tax=Melastoma candidum TaxID=119954 RepID=A0ACB9RSP9_9MYRT|nr:hypothetical protein MLD38_007343 [Melastoma candidum]
MAATANVTPVFGDKDNNPLPLDGTTHVSRREIQAAIAKAVDLRALHAALTHNHSSSADSPAPLPRFPASPSPFVPHSASSHLSAADYPVFTPSYGGELYRSESQALFGNWNDFGFRPGKGDESGVLLDYGRGNPSSRKGFNAKSVGFDSHICPIGDDQRSVTASSAINITAPSESPGPERSKSGHGDSMEDVKSVSSCNRCRPAVITSVQSNTVVPLTNPLPSQQTKVGHGSGGSGGAFLSRFLPRIKKKHKNENSPNRTEPEDVTQIIKDLGRLSIEALKKELIEAHENRDAALAEVAEMRSSLGELRDKLEYLETYCEGLKKALKQATVKESQPQHQMGTLSAKGKSVNSAEESPMPVTEEVMTEGFLQLVSEARLSVRQFCKILFSQVEEADNALMESLDTLLRPYNLSVGSRYSKAVSYHLEAIINESLYQNFENCVFQRNGSPKILDPLQNRQSQFAAFVALRNLSWNEVLRKGTKYYSEEFSQFCDQKMSTVITAINWTRPWPEQLLQGFFVAAKCLWLLHLLAFSFDPPIQILRVAEGMGFNPKYMEDVFADRQRLQCSNRAKVMVVPGFYVGDRILKCKVVCRYKSVT